ncbi:MAG: hypothetical protein ABW221_01620 [Vicinamibacteria bacterium]
MRTAAKVASCLVLVSGFFVPRVGAQSADVAQAAAAAPLMSPANLSSGAPLGSSGYKNGFIGEFVLEGSTDDKVGVASVSWKDGHNSLQFKATSALSGGVATPFSLDGLSANSSIELSYNRLEFPALDDDRLDEITERAQRHCRSNPNHPLRVGRSDKEAEELKLCTTKAGDLKYLTGADLIEAREMLGQDGRIWFWGGGLTAARTTFDYLDESTLAEQSVEKRSASWNVRAGVFTSYFGFLIGSYSFVKQWGAAGAAQNICQPLEGTAAMVCGDAVIGAPVETTRSVLRGEFRKFFSGAIAFAPSVQRDLKKKVTLVTLPVYFLKNKDGDATGGLRLTWRSDTETTTVSVFVGAALKPR